MNVRGSTLPSLFGRFTAALSQHENLNEALGGVEALCEALDAGDSKRASRLQPARLIADLRSVLATHFAVEESDIYFAAIARERPRLFPKLAELKAEHDVMLSIAARLREMASVKSSWPQIAAPARVLLTMLEAHERAESRLLNEFLSGEVS